MGSSDTKVIFYGLVEVKIKNDHVLIKQILFKHKRHSKSAIIPGENIYTKSILKYK